MKPAKKDAEKRLNVDLSVDLHCRFKLHCVERGLDMTAEIRRLIEKALVTSVKGKK